MKRLHFICEGQTEETFVNELLRDHLARFDVLCCPALVGKPGHKGGHVSTERMCFDVKQRLLGDPSAYCTTFFDFYGLNPDFAGKKEAVLEESTKSKAETVERALLLIVEKAVGEDACRRFLPYVQMHEFEGLLFSDPHKLASGILAEKLTSDFCEIRSKFQSPEDINDSPETAPSKRILSLMPKYEKPLYGSLAALEVGLDRIRAECSRFDAWLSNLESLRGQDRGAWI